MAIQSYACRNTKALHETGQSRRFERLRIARAALRKLDMLHAAHRLLDLRSPPGNRLEALAGDRLGQYSVRINDQWRLCFRWTDAGPEDVEIVDYHD